MSTGSVDFGELEAEAARILGGSAERDARLQALCDLLRERVPHYDWVGFYLVPEDEADVLVLGPFSGAPTEHVRIGFGLKPEVLEDAASRIEKTLMSGV